LEQHSNTKTDVEINTPSISWFSDKRQTELESSSTTASENHRAADEPTQRSGNLFITLPENNKSGYELRRKSSNISVLASVNSKSGDELRRNSARLLTTTPDNTKSGSEHVHTLEQQSNTNRKSEVNTSSISCFFDKRQTASESSSTTASENHRAATELTQRSASLPVAAHENNRSENYFKRSSGFSAIATESGKSVEDSIQKSASLSGTTPENNRSGNKPAHTLKQQSGTKMKVATNTPSISTFVNKRQTKLDVLAGPSSHSSEMEQNNMYKRTEDRHSAFNKSVKPQSVPLVHRWQGKTTASENAFNLLSRTERSTKLQELVTEVKKKHDEALKSKPMKGLFSRQPSVAADFKVNPAVHKRTGSRKPCHPALLVNGKPYRPPRLKRPKSWVTPRLYKLLIPKCEEKYGVLEGRRRAEQFAVFLCEKVCNIRLSS
jgi:hypothetical protein